VEHASRVVESHHHFTYLICTFQIELERSRPTDIASPEGLALGASSMEVDAPGPSLSQALTDDPISAEDLVLNPLKRSNSAPMINVLVAASAASCSASVSGLTALRLVLRKVDA